MKTYVFLRRVICICLALLLFGITPVEILAATYTAGTADEMESSWAAASSNTDTENYIHITDDIDMEGRILEVESRKRYHVQSQNNEDHTLSNVRLDGGDDGGVVYIRTDVTSSEGAALTVGGDVTLNVIGDVTTTSSEKDDGNNPVVEVYDEARVTINGDVSSEEAGISVSNSSLIVTGDVTLKSEGDDYNNFVVDAYKSDVQIKGDVTSEELGILAMEKSTVTVDGNVSIISKDVVDMNNNAIIANSNSSVLVTGDVYSEEGGLAANDAQLTVKGNVDVEGVSSFVSDSTGLIKGSYTATPSESNTDPNSGVWVWDSSLTIDKGLTTTDLAITNGSTGDIGVHITADSVSVGTEYTNDPSKLYTNDINGNLYAAGTSTTQVIGDVNGHITAVENAKVTVLGKVDSHAVYDNAVLSIRNTNVNTGTAAPETIVSPESSEDTFATLCKAYGQGSALYEYTSSLMQARSDARYDILDELNLGDAVLVSLFDRYGISLDTLDLPRVMMNTTFIVINPITQEAIANADVVSGYHVQLYKETLHEIMTSTEMQSENLAISKDEVKSTVKLIKAVCNIGSNASELLSKEQLAVFNQYTSSDGLELDEALKFLLEFDFITEIDASAKATAQRMVDMFNLCESLKSAGKAIDAIEFLMDSAEFIDYWTSIYESQIAILDDMIYNQPMNAELAIAAIQLREEYFDKFAGTLLKLIDKGKEEVVKELKKFLPLLIIVDGAIDLTGLVTGATQYSKEVMEATALFDIVPQMQINFENAIARIQQGDTSEEALLNAENAHALLVESLKRLCEAAIEICDDDVAAKYQNILNQLETNPDYTALNIPR